MPATLPSLLQQLGTGRAGFLPQSARTAAAASLQRYGDAVAEGIMQEVITRFFGGLESILTPHQELREGGTTATVGATPQTVRADITALLNQFDEGLADTLNLDFKIKVANQVAAGAGRFVADQSTVDEYPAWELKRVYDRRLPRGDEPKNPSDPWPVRWTQAAALVDEGELLLSILKATGRMIALKSSGIWEVLGQGAGGHDDALGNPFAPFAFNSGYDTEGVSRRDCIDLGLLRRDEEPTGSRFDWGQLIQLPEAA